MNTTSLRRTLAGLALTFAMAISQAQTSFINYDYMGNADQLVYQDDLKLDALEMEGRKILFDKRGGIYVAGTGLSDGEGRDMILLKYTWNGSNFSLVWSYKYNGPDELLS